MNIEKIPVHDRDPAFDPAFAGMQDKAKGAAAFLRALGQEHRLMVLCRLVQGEMSVSELSEALDLRQPALSQHLARLRAEGLVTTRRQGTAIYYALEDRRVLPLIEVLYDLFCTPDGFAERAGKAQRGPDND